MSSCSNCNTINSCSRDYTCCKCNKQFTKDVCNTCHHYWIYSLVYCDNCILTDQDISSTDSNTFTYSPGGSLCKRLLCDFQCKESSCLEIYFNKCPVCDTSFQCPKCGGTMSSGLLHS